MASSPSAPASAPATAGPVTIITQTRVLPDRNDDFAEWQQRISDVVAGFPGFVDHQVIPPDPPQQVDWVILQKFATAEQAQAWLRSKERLRLLEDAQPMLVGQDDVHIIEGDEAAQPADAVSAVISMEIKPGQEEAYRVWNQRITAAETQYPGFQGHRLNPPIPGVQDDWVTILTFDTEAHLDAWLNSPERHKLLERGDAVLRGGARPQGPHRVRSVVPGCGRRPGADLEAEHADAAGALPGRLSLRLFRAEPDSDRGG